MRIAKVLKTGLAASLALCLTACGSSGGQGEGDSTEKTGSDVTITFTTNVVGAKAEALQEACKAFEEEKGYTVDFQAPGDSYEELMKTKMSANELPDVFTTHGWSVARYSDYLMTVNELAWAADIDEQIKPVITNADGDMFVLPIDMDVAGIIYNVSVLEEAGVNPDEIKTWDDFASAAEKIKAAGKTPIHIGGKDNWTIGQYFDWAAPSYFVTDEASSQAENLKNGTFDTATWEKVAGMLDTWVSAGYLNSDVLTADYNADMKALAEGTTAFCFYGNSSVVDATNINPDAKIGIMPIPAANASDEPSMIAGEDIAVGVWKDSKVKEQATELLNYLAKPEVAKKIAEAAGSKAGLSNVNAEIGEIGTYLEKYADVETFPYFDREYLPSGMWDVMCSTGADILAQKKGAVENAAKIMEQNFNDKYVK